MANTHQLAQVNIEPAPTGNLNEAFHIVYDIYNRPCSSLVFVAAVNRGGLSRQRFGYKYARIDGPGELTGDFYPVFSLSCVEEETRPGGGSR